jgi:hypothetical protein
LVRDENSTYDNKERDADLRLRRKPRSEGKKKENLRVFTEGRRYLDRHGECVEKGLRNPGNDIRS